MPLHYDIIYDSTTGAHHCGSGTSLTVDLVQHAIVKHDGSYVEEIVIIYSPDPTNGNYPPNNFALTLTNNSYDIEPITDTVLDRDNGCSIDDPVENGDDWTVTVNAPNQNGPNGTTLFEFGTSSGPPTKVKLKVKRVPTTYSC